MMVLDDDDGDKGSSPHLCIGALEGGGGGRVVHVRVSRRLSNHNHTDCEPPDERYWYTITVLMITMIMITIVILIAIVVVIMMMMIIIIITVVEDSRQSQHASPRSSRRPRERAPQLPGTHIHGAEGHLSTRGDRE
jgi:hypothetical protein